MSDVYTAYLINEPPCRVIGPQIGPLFSKSGVIITIGLPHLNVEEIFCRLFDEYGQQVLEKSCTPAHPKYRNYTFEFANLDPAHQYSYKFYFNNEQLELGAGLTYDDCCFRAPEFVEGDCFILLSCNNPQESAEGGNAGLAMWDKVLTAVQNNAHIKFLIQGGDQVYNDAIEVACLKRLEKNDSDDADWVIKRIIENYQHYYSSPSYRKVLARVPSVAMLDDHDITDGWGGRPDGFTDEGKFKDNWSLYLKHTYDAFKEYQSSKNPLHRISEGVESTFLDFGNNRLYLLDLRREKNIKQAEAPLISEKHRDLILGSLDQIPTTISSVYILTPVVAVRIKPEVEDTAIKFADSSYRLHEDINVRIQKVKTETAIADNEKDRGTSFAELLLLHGLKFATELAGNYNLGDDMSDGLSSPQNLPFLIALLTKLDEIQRKHGVKCCILSGDIHSGGVSEIICFREGDTRVVIPQVVSSPISSTPMMKPVKDSTTTEGEISIGFHSEGVQLKLVFRNLFYRSARNFCVITPHKKVDFCFERLTDPITYVFP